MPFPVNIKEDVLVACGRCCCICHKFCGVKIEVHHIKQEADGGSNTIENAIPLCFDCHADMGSNDPRHPGGNRYRETELIRHRDNWYQKVSGNIGVASPVAVIEADTQIYRHIVSLLPWEVVASVSTNNFAGFSFRTSLIEPFCAFEHHNTNPAVEFLDPDLENIRGNLIDLIDNFTSIIANETFSISASNNTVPPEWEHEQPEHFERVVSQIHGTAQRIKVCYEDLVRTARRKLGALAINAE